MVFHIEPKFYDELLGFIRKSVHNDTDASDILHDVLMKAQEKYDSLLEPEKFIPWVYQIARNMITDYYRKKKDIVEIDDSMTMHQDNRSIRIRANSEIIPQLLEKLPEEYQQVYMLYEKGLSHKEIAEKLAISVSLSKTRVVRAKKKLEEMLKNVRCKKMIINKHDMSVKYVEEIVTLEDAMAIDAYLQERDEEK